MVPRGWRNRTRPPSTDASRLTVGLRARPPIGQLTARAWIGSPGRDQAAHDAGTDDQLRLHPRRERPQATGRGPLTVLPEITVQWLATPASLTAPPRAAPTGRIHDSTGTQTPPPGIAVYLPADILVDAVLGDVAGEAEGAVGGHDLGGEVLPLVPRRTLHPVGRLPPDRRDPGPCAASERRSGPPPLRPGFGAGCSTPASPCAVLTAASCLIPAATAYRNVRYRITIPPPAPDRIREQPS